MEPTPFLTGRNQLGHGLLLQVQMPALTTGRAGQYLLIRPSATWTPYLRRPIFPCAFDDTTLTFWGNPAQDEGLAWLSSRSEGESLDLIGPLGNGFQLHHQQRRLLLVAESGRVAPLLALINPQLNRQGSVGLLLEAPTAMELLPPTMLPPAVEYYAAAVDGTAGLPGGLTELLPKTLQWADVVCAAGSLPFLQRLQQQIAQERLGLHRGFALVIAPVPLSCGVGACLACLVPARAAGGRHRACVRGPVFDLAELDL